MDLVRSWAAKSKRHHEILGCSRADGESNLVALQVTTRSPMGAIAYETGGIMIDHGWIRVLGAASTKLPRSLATWNGIGGTLRLPGAMLVGDDAIGGFFAINGGRLGTTLGNVFYFAPDTLAWEDTSLGYSTWLQWLFEGDVSKFYEASRWPGWEEEVAAIDGTQALSIYPFLSAAGPPVAQRSRRPVPVDELFGLHVGP